MVDRTRVVPVSNVDHDTYRRPVDLPEIGVAVLGVVRNVLAAGFGTTDKHCRVSGDGPARRAHPAKSLICKKAEAEGKLALLV
jgi:hypothetical protein